jgi:energy-coupling factor transporter ATP-binding protein EcfA2
MADAVAVAHETAVLVENVRLEYPPPRRIRALDGVSARFDVGAFVAIVGQNGSGKTSLARCISGFLKPTGGQVLIGGIDVQRLPPARRARHVGYVFQNPDHQLFKESVWDDVAFGLRNLRVPPAQIDERVESTLRRLDLWAQRDRHPFRLSKGDRQRLAIAAVIVMRPGVLIVDEPTTGQDPARSREIMDLLAELNRDGMTVIVITHVMELVAEYARQMLVLHAGRLLVEGAPRDVFGQPELLAVSRVSPPPVARLALELGLQPLPITIAEVRDSVLQRLAAERVAPR